MRDPKRKVTAFKNVSSRETATITVERLFQYISEGRWRNWVERIRQAAARGDRKEMDRLKKKLTYFCFGGLFAEGSHAASCLTEYSALVVLDYDHVLATELERLKDIAMASPHVIMAYITPSGSGLKLVVLTDARREEHPLAYAQVAAYYDGLLGIPSDGACKDISRGHFGSYDEWARYNGGATPFAVQREEAVIAETAPAEPSPVAEPAPAEPSPVAEPAPAAVTASQEPATAEAGIPSLPSGITGEELVRIALSLYPAAEGKRNVRLFHIACAACSQGLPAESIVRGAVAVMACDTFDAREIGSVVKSAYSRTKAGKVGKKGENTTAKCTLSAQVPIDTPATDTESDEEDGIFDGEELREHTPSFPQTVYDALPDFFSVAMKYTSDPRERDMLLLSILTLVSALIPTTSGFYRHRRISAHFYTFVVAPAASGKGVMDYGFSLLKYFLKEIAEENDQLERKYKEACEAYDKHLRNRKKGDKDLSKPEPPTYRYLQIPATVSKSRFLMHLRDNREWGGFIFDLEADTMTAAVKQDYGNYFDYLRKIFHHETVSDSFKVNEKPTYVYTPRLAILLAGTPAQFVRMFGSLENGLPSRFLNYTHRQQALWQDVSPAGDEEEVERHFDRLSMRLHQMLRFLYASSTRVKLSELQWTRLNKFFAALLEREKISECDDFQSTIKRYCLIVFRICLVLTSIEKATLRVDQQEMRCSDANFETALSIVACCLEHSRLLVTSLPAMDKDTRELQNPNKTQLIFDRLPLDFTTEQFLEKAAFFEMGRRKAFKVLKNSIGLIIKKIKKGVYRKVS